MALHVVEVVVQFSPDNTPISTSMAATAKGEAAEQAAQPVPAQWVSADSMQQAARAAAAAKRVEQLDALLEADLAKFHEVARSRPTKEEKAAKQAARAAAAEAKAAKQAARAEAKEAANQADRALVAEAKEAAREAAVEKQAAKEAKEAFRQRQAAFLEAFRQQQAEAQWEAFRQQQEKAAKRQRR